MRRFLLVGLTGGIATGKSTVSEMFRRLGGVIIDADLLAREVVEPGEPALAQIAAEFGPGVLALDGTLDRKTLGAVVFADPARRKRLEQLTHPAIRDRFVKRLAELEARGFDGIVLWDAPVMIESGGYKNMDRLVVVATDEATQAARLRAREGIDAVDAERKIRSQMPVAEKAKLADYVIDNAGDRAATEARARRVHSALMAEANVAKRLLSRDTRRRIAPLGVVFSVNMGNRGQNEIPPRAVFRDLRRLSDGAQFVGYHWRRSGNFIFVRSDTESDATAATVVASVTKLDAISRSFSALFHVDWGAPVGTKTTPGGSVILDESPRTWRLIVVFLSADVPPEKQIVGSLTPKIRTLTWPSARDVLCAYDRPGEAGDVGHVTRAAVLKLRGVATLPGLLGSGRAMSVVRDILRGHNLRDTTPQQGTPE